MTTDKASGYTDQVVGCVKQNVGRAVGNEKLESEGMSQKRAGEISVEAAKFYEREEGTAKQITGTVKENVGWVIGDKDMEGRGRLEKDEGRLQKESNS